MQRYALALDLKDEDASIAEYIEWHRHVWPEILRSIRDSGITQMQIFHRGDRLFMLMETDDSFSFARKQAADVANPKVQEWEKLMSSFQKTLPGAKPGEKWLLMKEIFNLVEASDVQGR